MNSIVFESVHKVFRQRGFFFLRKPEAETHALKGISLTVSAGEVLGLLGPNGSGKSTTLKLISTMLLPDLGHVVVQGCDTRRHGQEVRRSVGFAMASERSFFPRLTIRENLEFFAALEDVRRGEVSDRIESVLSCVSLTDVAGKQVMKISSGMYQRLGIARALIKRPSVLLLDEPTRSLDAAAAGELWRLIHEMSSMGITVLLATHNFEEAAAVCDRVALLQEGELRAIEKASNFAAEELREFYLETTREAMPEEFRLGVLA
ncbi:MAG: transporter, ATP-binding protein [Acidobacteriaceae bacterium]|nr:transporter, ATP-binding protein [Acidobacteriaceae bacterium]